MTKKEIFRFLKGICEMNAQMEINTWQKLLHRKLRPEEVCFIRKDWLNDEDSDFFSDVFPSVS